MVIQRWQSVLLLIAVVLMGCFTFMSLGQVQTTDFSFNFKTLGLYPEGESTGAVAQSISTWYFFAISLLSTILPLIAIFAFKNFKLQKNLCLWSMLLITCLIIVGALLAYQTFDGASISWSSLVCAPFISLISISMAYNRIVRDWNIIRDSERIR